jgi:hypothetical protein
MSQRRHVKDRGLDVGSREVLRCREERARRRSVGLSDVMDGVDFRFNEENGETHDEHRRLGAPQPTEPGSNAGQRSQRYRER